MGADVVDPSGRTIDGAMIDRTTPCDDCMRVVDREYGRLPRDVSVAIAAERWQLYQARHRGHLVSDKPQASDSE